MLIHGVEVNKDLEYEKLLRIYECGDNIKEIRDQVLESHSKYKLKKLGYWALRKIIKKALKELKYFQIEIVKNLTNAQDPGKHINYISDFIKEAGITKKSVDGEIQNPYKAILNIATYISVKLNKTPKEIIKNTTPQQTPIIIAEINKSEILEQMNRVTATHGDPVKTHKRLQRQYRIADTKRKSALSNAREQIKDEKVVQITSFKDMVKNALSN